MFRGLVLVAWLIAASWSAAAADAPATITILEGNALVYRAAQRLQAAEGVRLALGDIVQSGEASLVQIELSDQSVLQLGPATQVMLDGGSRRKPERWIYLMNGWAKRIGPAKDSNKETPFDLRSPLFEAPAGAATLVLFTKPDEVVLFVERGDIRIGERQASGPATPISLRSNDTYRRRADARGVVSQGVPQSFVSEMPKSFRDSLPLRIDRFQGREVKPKDAPPFAYEDVEPWLKAERDVRRQFVKRWRAKAKEPPFRTALIDNLSAHPEWDPVLFPEKYLPKDPPRPPWLVPNPPTAASAPDSPTAQ